MNITPSHGTLQAFGSSTNSTAPAAQARQPVASEQTERPAKNTQTVDAAPRPEAPARPDADARSSARASAPPGQPGAKLDLVV